MIRMLFLQPVKQKSSKNEIRGLPKGVETINFSVTSGSLVQKSDRFQQGYLLLAWQNRKFWLENQMVVLLHLGSFKRYIEDITWPCRDTKLLFEWAQRTSEIFFQHEKRNFVSPSGHVIFYLLYRHPWTIKPFHFNSFLVWKARFIM